jgi:hypothetical protein
MMYHVSSFGSFKVMKNTKARSLRPAFMVLLLVTSFKLEGLNGLLR